MSTRSDITSAGEARLQARALVTLALPLVGSLLAQTAVQITDTLMLGWYDVEALAGLVLAGSVYFTLFMAGLGFSMAVMPLAAAAASRDDERQVRRATRMGLWMALGCGVLAMPVMIFADRLFLAIGQDPGVAGQAGLYLDIMAFGMIPSLLIMALRSYASAIERTRIVLWVTVGSATLNVALNYLLIFGHFGAPELGIRGAALASVTSHSLAFVGLALWTRIKTPQYELFRNFHRPDADMLGSLWRLGWPISLTNLAEVGLFAMSSVLMGWVSPLALAAHGIALQIATVTFMVHLGLSQAVTVRVGRAYGQRDAATLRLSARVATLMSLVVAAATVTAFVTLPELLVGLFVDPEDPQRPALLQVGVSLLIMAAVFQVVDALQVMALGMLRGVQDTRAPMIYANLAYWAVGLPACYGFGFVLGWGAVGIWWGLVAGLSVAALLLNHRFWLRSGAVAAISPAT